MLHCRCLSFERPSSRNNCTLKCDFVGPAETVKDGGLRTLFGDLVSGVSFGVSERAAEREDVALL